MLKPAKPSIDPIRHTFKLHYKHLYLTQIAQKTLTEYGYSPAHIERVARKIREGKI